MKERVVRYSKEELKKLKGKTDHAYIRITSDAEIERQVKTDPDSYIPTKDEIDAFQPARKDKNK